MWKERIIQGHLCKAWIYDDPSRFGINGGRISKLMISIGNTWEGMSKTIYHYDRGLDFDNTPPGLLDKALQAFTN